MASDIWRRYGSIRDFKSTDARTRERALSKLSKGTASTRLAIRLLRDPDRFVRDAALERLRAWDAWQSLPVIVPRLRDPYDIARVTALECVAAWGTARHRRFIKPLLTDRSPLVRAYAAWALGVLGAGALQQVLQRRLKSERHPIPRAALHEVLFGLTGHDRHLNALLRALCSVNHRVACFAARSLSNCVTTATRRPVRAALRRAQQSDTRLAVRETAGLALRDVE